MKRVLLICALLMLASVCLAQEETPRFDFPLNGFSIESLEGKADSSIYQILSMYLPASGDFSPNVNVQVQPYEGTAAEYMELSTQQFESLGWDLIEDTLIGDNALTLEYTADLSGYSLHFFSRALLREGKVYLATGAATIEQWPDQSERIMKCVNSLRLE